jgi:hypothetical protein
MWAEEATIVIVTVAAAVVAVIIVVRAVARTMDRTRPVALRSTPASLEALWQVFAGP